jgi:hypothetical protein
MELSGAAKAQAVFRLRKEKADDEFEAKPSRANCLRSGCRILFVDLMA